MKYLQGMLFLLALLNACNEPNTKTADKAPVVAVATKSKNSDAFNKSFQTLLTSYYSLKDAMIETDTTKINAASNKLAKAADSLRLDAITNDSTGNIVSNAKNFAGTINGSSLGLAGETAFAKKKKEFQMISDAMYDLVRTVRYDQEKIYHQHCPMALNDSIEAYWLSNSDAIVNPYLGKKHPKYKDAMVSCGDVTDSLDFSKR